VTWSVLLLASLPIVAWSAYTYGMHSGATDPERVAQDRAAVLVDVQREIGTLSERMGGRASTEYLQGLHDARCLIGRQWALELAGDVEECPPSVSEPRPWLRAGHVLR
jgi:hypothetical protein